MHSKQNMKKYFRKTLEYTAGNLFNKLLHLFLLPIFTHLMLPEEFAVYANLLIFISFISLIYFLGLQQAIFSYFYQKKTNEYKFSIISTIYITLLICGIILSFMIVLFRSQLSLLIVRTEIYQQLFIWISLILFFDVIYGMTLSFLNIMERSANYALLSIVKNTLFLILVIIGTILKKLDINSIFLFLMISSFCAAIVALIDMRKVLFDLTSIKFKKIFYSIPLIKNLLKFGIIIIPGTIAMITLRVFDRYMLTYLSPNSLYDVGIYAIGYRVGMIMQFLVSMVSMVYFPYAMRISDQPDATASYKKVFNYYLLWGGILGFLIILFAAEIFYIFIDKAYYPAIKIVFFGVISNFLLGVFNIINISFYVKKRAGKIAVAVGIGALLNIILNYLFIPKFGIYGAGGASIFAYLFIVIFNYFAAEKVYFVGYRFGYVILSLIVLLIFSSFNFIFSLTLLTTIFKIIIVIMASLILFYQFYRIGKIKEILNLFLSLKPNVQK